MATQDEMTRARILALKAPSQMKASPFIPTGGRPNPLTQMQSGPRPMTTSRFIPTGVAGRNPLAGMMSTAPQGLPFPNQGVVRPTFPTPPVFPPPPEPYRGPDTTIPPWLQRTDPYYGSPLDQKNETPWSEIPRWQKQPR